MDAGLEKAVQAITLGYPLYVGCMGGKGRTGLFLAVLAKAWGIKNPVEYVRANYYPHAVETKEQYAYVTNFKVSKAIRRRVWKAKAKSLVRFGQKDLTNHWKVD
jgi:protein-tyrosine phosphatase